MHICIILVISCLEAHLSSFCSLFVHFSTKKHSGPDTLSRLWRTRGPLDPSKKHLKTNTFSTFPLFGPTKPEHICIMLAISCLEAPFSSFFSFSGRFFYQNHLSKPRSLEASKFRSHELPRRESRSEIYFRQSTTS